jgi:hypothetical protein
MKSVNRSKIGEKTAHNELHQLVFIQIEYQPALYTLSPEHKVCAAV